MAPACQIPTVDTPDLILRGYREADFDAIAAFGASERARFVGGPHDRWACWRSFLAGVGHWGLRGFGMWVVEHRSSGQVAGRVGMILNDGWHEPELGWHIYDGFEGLGLAFQAAHAARAYAAQHQGLDQVISYINAENSRSVRLAHRLGATLERDTELLGQPCQIFRHPAVADITAPGASERQA
ncbi:GNAT family N-acetyltransferase [Pseudohalocynthiibacter aestuariivivens]|uniref:GNAT family N-acetyltransferase n=1 Tax=Roseovarius pelagicus TaxID=2980108 RepID=A0ABY6DG95_9RHOB|nr:MULTISPECIES: GNAT family N-acetyltransferase [Rhodobacterales]QIE47592.1 GNAT family N-acetyltransferase [Pseudohalocynthiibacter aestuariivivens]UXX85133.1 GNAT family N-acetyltransferase [Roseovarius pelagicus]